jgi:hypothetical protein
VKQQACYPRSANDNLANSWFDRFVYWWWSSILYRWWCSIDCYTFYFLVSLAWFSRYSPCCLYTKWMKSTLFYLPFRTTIYFDCLEAYTLPLNGTVPSFEWLCQVQRSLVCGLPSLAARNQAYYLSKLWEYQFNLSIDFSTFQTCTAVPYSP